MKSKYISNTCLNNGKPLPVVYLQRQDAVDIEGYFKKSGKKGRDIAIAAKISPAYLSQILSGSRGIKETVIEALMVAINPEFRQGVARIFSRYGFAVQSVDTVHTDRIAQNPGKINFSKRLPGVPRIGGRMNESTHQKKIELKKLTIADLCETHADGGGGCSCTVATEYSDEDTQCPDYC